jgi:hypothetical protein
MCSNRTYLYLDTENIINPFNFKFIIYNRSYVNFIFIFMKKCFFHVLLFIISSYSECFSTTGACHSKPPKPGGWTEHVPFIDQKQSASTQEIPSSEQPKPEPFEGSYITDKGTIHAPAINLFLTPDELYEQAKELKYSNRFSTGLSQDVINYIIWCNKKTKKKEALDRGVPEWIYNFVRLSVYNPKQDYFHNAIFEGRAKMFCPLQKFYFSPQNLDIFIFEATILSSLQGLTGCNTTLEHATSFSHRFQELNHPTKPISTLDNNPLKAVRVEGQDVSFNQVANSIQQVATAPAAARPYVNSTGQPVVSAVMAPKEKRRKYKRPRVHR